eukprot:SAG22_NODE_227_length_14641_cov_11.007908_7_plen_418_part_00
MLSRPLLLSVYAYSSCGAECSRVGRGPCIPDGARPFPACLAGRLAGGDLFLANLTLPAAVRRCRGSARCAGFSAATGSAAAAAGGGGGPSNSTVFEFHFKDGYGARRLEKAAGWSSWQDAAKGGGEGQVNNTNIIAMHTGGTGILYDERDANASRRYKLFGGIDWCVALSGTITLDCWTSALPVSCLLTGVLPGGCRHLCTARPASNVAVDGTAWPPCRLTGADYSADGIHFEHGANESTIPASQVCAAHQPWPAINTAHPETMTAVPATMAMGLFLACLLTLSFSVCLSLWPRLVLQFYDVIGQNDGTLDVAIYDEVRQRPCLSRCLYSPNPPFLSFVFRPSVSPAAASNGTCTGTRMPICSYIRSIWAATGGWSGSTPASSAGRAWPTPTRAGPAGLRRRCVEPQGKAEKQKERQ